MFRYRITELAEEDIVSLAAYTLENFGEQALDRYLKLIEVALLEICRDSSRIGIKEFDDGILKFHLRNCRDEAATKWGG